MKGNQLTQEFLDVLFAIYCKALRSHYPAPRLENVQKELKNTGKYEYRTGPAKVWQAVLTLAQQDGDIAVAFNYKLNSQYQHMEKGILKMKAVFDEELQRYMEEKKL